MPGLMVNQGEGITLSALLNLGLSLKLFKNNYTLVDASTESNLTEADFPGYADVDLVLGDWTITPGAPSEAVTAQQHFEANATVTPTQTIYGYYFVVTATGELVWGENFDTPKVMSAAGDYLNIIPKLQLKKVGE